MTERLVNSMEPEQIGDLIASDFNDGEPYVHLKGFSFAKSSSVKRSSQILAVCKRVGAVEQIGFDSMDAVERLDGNTERRVPKKHFHTSGAALPNPEKIVSYWNGRPLDRGDTIDILPMDRVIEYMSNSPDPHMQLMLDRLQEKLQFEAGHAVTDPIYNPHTKTVRFDKDVIDVRDINRVDAFFRFITEEQQKIDSPKNEQPEDRQQLAESIELGGGDAIFFKNSEVLHRRRLSRAESRLTFRVLLETVLVSPQRGVENVVSVGPYL